MGFFLSWFAGDRTKRADDPESALAELEAVRTQADRDPRGAAKRLRAAGRRHHAQFDLRGPHHGVFRAAYEALHGAIPTEPSDVHVLTWESLGEEPSLRALMMQLESVRAGRIVLLSEDPRGESAPAGQLEALALLDADPSVALVVAGDVDLVVRASFLAGLSVPGHLLDVSEVILELADLAVASGLQARSVPA
ncbi:MAG: hypothetical protein EA416_08330 [Trueperaceae bacterium]|nr:MAG: hypothetical protein EA416_08330 [Trueperaceae bacterium]